MFFLFLWCHVRFFSLEICLYEGIVSISYSAENMSNIHLRSKYSSPFFIAEEIVIILNACYILLAYEF